MFVDSIFDAKDTSRGWDKSDDWKYTNNGWQYSSSFLNDNK